MRVGLVGGLGLSASLAWSCVPGAHGKGGQGSTCNSHDDCDASLYCDFGLEPKCQPRQEEGEDCNGRPCLEELACTMGPMGSVCAERTATGQACRGHLECQSIYCPRGFCEERPGEGEECALGICEDGLQCTSNGCR